MFRKMWKIEVSDESNHGWFCAYAKIVLLITETVMAIVQESRDFLIERRLTSLRVLTHTRK